MSQLLKLLIILCGISFATVNCLERQGARRLSGTSSDGTFKSACGTKEEVAKRTSACLRQLFETVEGRFPSVPKSDAEMMPYCDRFSTCEKCLRAIGKDCLSGIHKAAVGAFASSTIRFKRQECKTESSRARLFEPMRCVKVIGPQIAAVYRNGTSITQGIRDLKISPEQKIVKLCCMLNELDRQLENRIDAQCPSLRNMIIEMIHSVTDDAKATLCLSNKCQGALNGVMSHKYQPGQENIIEPVMEILLTLSTE